MTTRLVRSLCLSALLFVVSSASAQELGDYRQFRLGSSVADVSALTAARPSDLRVVHERPALLQDLAWRPRFAAGTPIPNPDPVDEIVFSFYNDQLFKIAVTYDNTRTAGLTREDITSALSKDYGAPTTVRAGRSTARGGYDAYDTLSVLAEWQTPQRKVTLSQATYGAAYSLSIVAVPVEALARTAHLSAVAMDAREAPARETARAKKQEDDARAEQERARATNKGGFRP